MGMQVGGSSNGDDFASDINVTPFVDVMLVLLVIFMITAPMMNTGVDIALPQATAQNIDDPEGKLILSIDKNQRVYLGKARIQWAELAEKLTANRRVQTERELYIEADQSLPYGIVVAAMAVAKNAGVAKVMMLTDPAEQMDIRKLDEATGDQGTNTAATPKGRTE